MRPKEGESYEAWIDRARMFEQGLAMQKIAEGQDIDIVLEEMSRRLMDKILHPIYKEIIKLYKVDFDVEQSRKDYEQKYLNNRSLVADHVDGTSFLLTNVVD
jgi:hypothetical protein